MSSTKLIDAFIIRGNAEPDTAHLVDADYHVIRRWVRDDKLERCYDNGGEQECYPPGGTAYGSLWRDFNGKFASPHVLHATYMNNNRPQFVTWNSSAKCWQVTYPHTNADPWYNNKNNQAKPTPQVSDLTSVFEGFPGKDANAGVTAAVEVPPGWVIFFFGVKYRAFKANDKDAGKPRQLDGISTVQAAFRGTWSNTKKVVHLHDGTEWKCFTVVNTGTKAVELKKA
ncbi:hypothetical protein SAMN04487905_12212 [Actinopolyspora xinjiangensis]|uniref:Uncharacterized protein n=1 Tax=Actinopolyspora xinjiangensis TaxID=405564 RepID=A0A1H0X218_9ACTN|nr:hypothetical protein [Actinopolyspora xinjiangensis]SDP96879.1 hypothetical protein SAMN04487905_12212 [Actinopolyspora xinjiangensis]